MSRLISGIGTLQEKAGLSGWENTNFPTVSLAAAFHPGVDLSCFLLSNQMFTQWSFQLNVGVRFECAEQTALGPTVSGLYSYSIATAKGRHKSIICQSWFLVWANVKTCAFSNDTAHHMPHDNQFITIVCLCELTCGTGNYCKWHALRNANDSMQQQLI